jgi:hypothetical protein
MPMDGCTAPVFDEQMSAYPYIERGVDQELPHVWVSKMVIDLDVEGIGFLGLDQSSREDAIDEDSSTRETIGCYFRVDNVKVVVDISSSCKREIEREKARQGE